MATKAERNQEYANLIFKAKHLNANRIVIGCPMTGLLRSEWALARWGQIIPCNWSHSDALEWMHQASPIGYAVAEARNCIVDKFIKSGAEWLFFIDHDVILPPDCFVKMNNYMLKGDIPVVCGLYFAKAHPPEPLVYRGRGNGFYGKWNIGDKVWVDGIPMGCTLIHHSLLKEMWKDAEEYVAGGNQTVRRVFDTPGGVIHDPSKGVYTYQGTEDLAWCNRVLAGNYLKKAGWPEIARKKYPFLVDTSIFCRHITNDGQVYPLPTNGNHSPGGDRNG